MSWIDGTRARLRLLFARRAAESRMNEEIGLHIDLETERLVREAGLERREARRRALVAFGGVEKHKEVLRDARGLAWLGGMKLDLTLGVRMLVKYPGLALVAVMGMAVAVAIGAVSFGIIYTAFESALPLDEGDRIVAIENIEAGEVGDGPRTHLHDMATWREDLRAVDIIGAYRTVDRNLITPGGKPEAVRIAEMTASGFRIARVAPLMGRYLSEEDERPGAPPVAVIGYTVWQNRFAGQPDVIGRTLQLGAAVHVVVGVMPPGFGFPINNRVWTPLQLDPTRFERGEAPALEVFARLAPGATLDDAETQLATIGKRLAAAYPTTHERIVPRVLPYTRSFLDNPEFAWVLHLVQALITMILMLIGTNVAILVYARTATRTGEIAVRTALGASRRRIVAQLFAEALVLSAVAAVVGLVAAGFAFEQIDARLLQFGAEQIPFWMDFGLTPGVILYVAGLAMLGAVIVGVAPALKATRRQVTASLQQLSPGGGSGMRLGKTWTALIVGQVAIAVAILPVTLDGFTTLVKSRLAAESSPVTREFLTAPLRLDREGVGTDDEEAFEGAFAARYASLVTEMVRRLEAEPGVADVVLASALPGGEPKRRLEVDGEPAIARSDSAAVSAAGHLVAVGRVDVDFFDVLDVPILAGRSFTAGDLAPDATGVIVNRSFVQHVLGGGDPLGRRIRPVAIDEASGERVESGPWYEIVGVVSDFPRAVDESVPEPRMYRAMHPGAEHPVILAVRVRGAAPESFADRLRALTVAVDPMLRLGRIGAMDSGPDFERQLTIIMFTAIALVTLSIVLLSAAGIYALMSFTIARRRREIGIRAALGAGPRTVLVSVLSRAAAQIGTGIVIGTGLVVLVLTTSDKGLSVQRIGLVILVAVLMSAVGFAAAIGPARRALGIQPTEALRAD